MHMRYFGVEEECKVRGFGRVGDGGAEDLTEDVGEAGTEGFGDLEGDDGEAIPEPPEILEMEIHNTTRLVWFLFG